MHEIPSSYVPVDTAIQVEPLNPDPIPGRREMTIRNPDGTQKTIILGFPNNPAVKVFAISGEENPPKNETLQLREGKQVLANIDGRSIHPVEVNMEAGTLITDWQEIFPIPSRGNDSPIRSLAEVTVTKTPDGRIRHDIILLYSRQPK